MFGLQVNQTDKMTAAKNSSLFPLISDKLDEILGCTSPPPPRPRVAVTVNTPEAARPPREELTSNHTPEGHCRNTIQVALSW